MTTMRVQKHMCRDIPLRATSTLELEFSLHSSSLSVGGKIHCKLQTACRYSVPLCVSILVCFYCTKLKIHFSVNPIHSMVVYKKWHLKKSSTDHLVAFIYCEGVKSMKGGNKIKTFLGLYMCNVQIQLTWHDMSFYLTTGHIVRVGRFQGLCVCHQQYSQNSGDR